MDNTNNSNKLTISDPIWSNIVKSNEDDAENNNKRPISKPSIGRIDDSFSSSILARTRQFLSNHDPTAPLQPLPALSSLMTDKDGDISMMMGGGEPELIQNIGEDESSSSDDSSSCSSTGGNNNTNNNDKIDIDVDGNNDEDDNDDDNDPGVVMEVGLGIFDVAGDVPTQTSAHAQGMTIVDIDPEERWGKPEPKIQVIEKDE